MSGVGRSAVGFRRLMRVMMLQDIAVACGLKVRRERNRDEFVR